jgi:hypothetical protein
MLENHSFKCFSHMKEISDILKSLNIKKASEHDLISHHMLKNTANTVSIPLKIIFDYSIQTSTFSLPISFLTRDQNNLGSDEFSSRKSFELRKNCCFAWIIMLLTLFL